MEQIASFSVNHEKMSRGIFLSRQDKVGDEVISTFDIRLKLPNREPVIDVPALHTIEHLGATFLRNHPEWAEDTIYFGPMGCRTGFYVIFAGDLSSQDVVHIITEMFQFFIDFKGDIPGATAMECGNYQEQNLDMAQWESRKFMKEVLQDLQSENLYYPED
ncbi:MAG: S-ribosylhomocysteine lyase [Alphaproteobacteria bacterium]